MTISMVELTDLSIQLTGTMHIGTGFERGLIDRTIVRGRDGLVYIPGSTVKGKVRDACESLARFYKISDCQAPYPTAMAKNRHRESCLICRIFGAPALPSSLCWHQASLTQDWADALRANMDKEKEGIYGQTQVRTQVQISRKRGVAAESRLFTSEFSTENMTFDGSPILTGRLELTPMTVAEDNDVYYELVLLLAGLKMIQTIGSGRSRGTGHCEIFLPETIQINQQKLSIKNQLKNIEGLSLYLEEREEMV